MIIEIETILFKNRDFFDPCYYQMCIEEDTNEVKGEDPGITLLKRNIKALQAENLQIKEEISSVKTLVENGQKEMRESFEKLSLAISARCNDKQ